MRPPPAPTEAMMSMSTEIQQFASASASGRIQFTPDLLPSDITGGAVLEESGGRKHFVSSSPRTALRELRARRRDQPRFAEDAVGAARGDAGAARHRARRDPRVAGAVLRARDAEPDRTRGHLSRCPKRSSTASS
jgi:hypothetical protein